MVYFCLLTDIAVSVIYYYSPCVNHFVCPLLWGEKCSPLFRRAESLPSFLSLSLLLRPKTSAKSCREVSVGGGAGGGGSPAYDWSRWLNSYGQSYDFFKGVVWDSGNMLICLLALSSEYLFIYLWAGFLFQMCYKQYVIPAWICSSRFSCPSLGAFFLLLDLCVWAAGLNSVTWAGDCPDNTAHWCHPQETLKELKNTELYFE